MRSITTYLGEIFRLIDRDLKKLPLIIIFFLTVSILDVIGISLIGPYAALLFSDELDMSSNGGGIFAKIAELGSLRDYIKDDRIQMAVIYGVGLVLLFFLKTVITIITTYKIWQFSMERQSSLRVDLMNSFQKQSYTSYISKESSQYLYTAEVLTKTYTGQVLQPLLQAVCDICIATCILIYLISVNVDATMALGGIAGVTAIAYYQTIGKRLRRYGETTVESSLDLLSTMKDAMRGFKEFRVLGVETFFSRRVVSSAKQVAKSQTKILVVNAVPKQLLELVVVIFGVIFAIFIISLDYGTSLSATFVAIFLLAAFRIIPIADRTTRTILSLRAHRHAVHRLYSEFSERQSISSSLVNAATADDRGTFRSLEMAAVSYKYPNTSKYIIQNASLTISAGQCIGILGESGSGKTTLVDLMLGLLSPQNGRVLINGEELKEDRAHWRDLAGYLPQNPVIFEGSINTNISFDSQEKDAKIIEDILNELNLGSMIERSPAGINSIVGEKGLGLSGGEQQRVALARLVFFGRTFLVLDEPSSALDAKTEKRLIETLERFKKNRTLVIVSHKQDVLRMCDRIFSVDGLGSVRERSKSEFV